ncbi:MULTISPECIES: helix-turn-helix domain-containing protein [unclassified Chitinophaga]|uniref:helix-turn-helix domain-containing protein n=1 Tax=unclassified Chitinophaga TaxID=2619133 RepID=UPI00300FDD5E
MKRIQEFNEISDYIKKTDLPASPRVSDFFIYSWSGIEGDACVNEVPYRNHYFEIILEVDPGCDLSVDDFVFPAGQSRLFFVSPYRLLSCKETKIGSPGNGFSVLFKPEFIHATLSGPGFLRDFPYFSHLNSPGVTLTSGEKDDILELLGKIQQEYDDSIYGREIIKNYLHILLLKGRKFYEQQASTTTSFSREQKIYNAFMLLVQEHFMKSDAVADYAKRLYISAKHLSQTVKNVSGKSALQIIHHTRLHHAKSLMRQTDLTIAQIASELNFENPDYFSVFFKRLTGESPTQFRSS